MSEAELDHLLALLPHHPPMRLVERIVEVVPGRSARATRIAHADDWYFDGHFPSNPVVPAVALVELLAQTGGLAIGPTSDMSVSALRLASLNDFKFPSAAGPGALLQATAEVVGRLGGLFKIAGTVTADGTLVASGNLTLAEVASQQSVGRDPR
jgi:3-hydroxymyristoyl/3-hydroxydecanoyl-(acyl carrier protein) dehydratase